MAAIFGWPKKGRRVWIHQGYLRLHVCPCLPCNSPASSNKFLTQLPDPLKCMRLHLNNQPEIFINSVLSKLCHVKRFVNIFCPPFVIITHTHTRVTLSSIPKNIGISLFSQQQLNSSATHIPGTDVLPTYRTNMLDHPWASTIHRSLHKSIMPSTNLD